MLDAEFLTVCGSKGQISCVLHVVCPEKQIPHRVFISKDASAEVFIIGVTAFVSTTRNTFHMNGKNTALITLFVDLPAFL